MTPKRRCTFWLNDREAEGLKAVKAAEGIAEGEQVRQAIRDWLRRKQVTPSTRTRGRTRRGQ